MVTVTGSVLLSGAGVPVGIPKDISPGDTATDVAASGAGAAQASLDPNPNNEKVAALTIRQTSLRREFMAHLIKLQK